VLEVQKTFDFYRASAASDRITRIVVSGGASRAEGFTEMLAERFQAPVETFDPFKKVSFDAGKFKLDATEIAPTAAVAVGLALRRVGDR
jgi:type IV pilus assembly protein PilM